MIGVSAGGVVLPVDHRVVAAAVCAGSEAGVADAGHGLEIAGEGVAVLAQLRAEVGGGEGGGGDDAVEDAIVAAREELAVFGSARMEERVGVGEIAAFVRERVEIRGAGGSDDLVAVDVFEDDDDDVVISRR